MKRPWLLLAALTGAYAQTPDIRVDVNLVTVAATVSDRNGAPAQGLRLEDFQLQDNGEKRDVKYLWQETDLPLTVGLIVDVSGSQAGLITKHRDDVAHFLRQVMTPRDRGFLVAVGADVKLVTDMTASIDDLLAGIDRIGRRGRIGTQLGQPCNGPGSPPRKQRRGRGKLLGCGGTALWNSVYSSAKLKMKTASGRKALIVFSDGLDTGSFHSLTDAIEAAQSADTLVYTIREISTMTKVAAPWMALGASLNHHMDRLSAETGGRAFAGTKGDPPAVFAQIETELRNLYVIGFTPPDGARDGVARKLELKVKKSGYTVRARRTYSVAAPTVE